MRKSTGKLGTKSVAWVDKFGIRLPSCSRFIYLSSSGSSADHDTDQKPYYARALTHAVVTDYKQNHFPSEDLVIYEVGGGNGSFMVDALGYIRDKHPEVYERTQFRIIEISAALAERQRTKAMEEGVSHKVQVIESDFFKWTGGGSHPCYVLALEVFASLLSTLWFLSDTDVHKRITSPTT